MNCKVLATRASVDRHTGVNLATEINDTMVKFGLEHVSKLNNKSESKGSTVDVKNVTKFLVGTPEETDNIIDEVFEAGAALFLTATHLTVARTLFRNCEEYANQIEASDGSDGEFKTGKTLQELKAMLCHHFKSKSAKPLSSKSMNKNNC